MLLFRLFNGLIAVSMFFVALDGINAIRTRELVYIPKRIFGKRKKQLLTGTEALIAGLFHIVFGTVFGLCSLIGAFGDVNFFGIPLNFFGGMLCFLPFALPLLLISFWLRYREKPKRKNQLT